MTTRIDDILGRIETLKGELEAAIAERRTAFDYEMRNGKARFEEQARKRQRLLRISLRAFLARAKLSHILTAPVIYSLIIPFSILDLFVTVYQVVCFPAYGIPKVRRADHIRIDRHMLAYLNGLQKLNCVYCGYCNGLLSYVREIAGRTEAFWCPIKHAGPVHGTHAHYAQFLDYGDAEHFREGLDASRDRIARED